MRLEALHANVLSFHTKLSLSEISGAFGDTGTFIPLVVTLARQRSISLQPALFFSGVTNVFNGLLWDLPMPVQPMKVRVTPARYITNRTSHAACLHQN